MVRTTYVLRVGGRLEGGPESNRSTIADVQGILPSRYPNATQWVKTFVPEGFHACAWAFEAGHGGPSGEETRIDFRVELCRMLEGTIYDNREVLDAAFRYFSHHRDHEWHRELLRQLRSLNEGIRRDRLRERIWFREWQIYAGNGGDH